VARGRRMKDRAEELRSGQPRAIDRYGDNG
jgi:hypothetical protein